MLTVHLFIFEQVEDMVGGLVNQAAQAVNFTNASFLPQQAQTSLNDFANASIQNINVTGKFSEGACLSGLVKILCRSLDQCTLPTLIYSLALFMVKLASLLPIQ